MRRLILSLISIVFCVYGVAQEIATESEKTFSGFNNIIINSDFCALTINKSESADIGFNGVIKSAENREAYKFEFLEEEGTLKINVIKPEQWKSHWGEIKLTVPTGVAIEVTSQSGKTVAENLSGVSIKVVSRSGHVVLKNIEGSVSSTSPAGDLTVNEFQGDLKSRTKSGAVIINNLAGNADVGCAKGTLVVNHVKGNLVLDGGEGNMEVENVEGEISLKSTNGDTKLSIAKGNIICRSFNGDIKLFNTNGSYKVQSSTGNITGTRVQFTASSSFTSTEGNIKMQMNTKKDLAFVLKSNNSYLRAMGKSKKKSLKVGKGSIVITGTSTSGSQAYY